MAKITNEFKTTLGDLPQTLIYILDDASVPELML